LIKQIHPDIYHTMVNYSVIQQFLASRWSGCPLFFITERNVYPLEGFSKIRKKFQYRFVQQFGGTVSGNAKAVVKHLLDSGIPGPIYYLPNGVDVRAFQSEKDRNLREKHGWRHEDIVIGYVGRFAHHKGQEFMLQCFERMINDFPNLKLCFIGDGPLKDELVRKTKEMHLDHYVTFLGVIDNVQDYMNAFDIVALFSQREGMPNVILEAMAAGKAIVATNVGGIPELLDRGRAGILIDPDREEQAMETLRQLIQDRALREKYGHRSRQQVLMNYEKEKVYSMHLQFYREMFDAQHHKKQIAGYTGEQWDPNQE